MTLRSVRRVFGLTAFGLLMSLGALGGAHEDPAAAVAFGPLGLFALGYAWWPRIVVTDDSVTVRNLRSVSFPWTQVRRITVADQWPHLGKNWNRLHRWTYRPLLKHDPGFLGICISTDSGQVPVMAYQGVSPWFAVRSTAPAWLTRRQQTPSGSHACRASRGKRARTTSIGSAGPNRASRDDRPGLKLQGLPC